MLAGGMGNIRADHVNKGPMSGTLGGARTCFSCFCCAPLGEGLWLAVRTRALGSRKQAHARTNTCLQAVTLMRTHTNPLTHLRTRKHMNKHTNTHTHTHTYIHTRTHARTHAPTVGAQLVVLGGPAMLIGLGGGAASSMATGGNTAELDFASVQRGNAEIQRRCVVCCSVRECV